MHATGTQRPLINSLGGWARVVLMQPGMQIGTYAPEVATISTGECHGRFKGAAPCSATSCPYGAQLCSAHKMQRPDEPISIGTAMAYGQQGSYVDVRPCISLDSTQGSTGKLVSRRSFAPGDFITYFDGELTLQGACLMPA